MYSNGTTYDCPTCDQPVIQLFEDSECTVTIGENEECWPCQEFDGPVDDMMDLWE